MAKKGGKLVTLVALGAAAAGTYYYFKKKNEEIPMNMEDDEDIDSFDEDVDAEPQPKSDKRPYVSLDFNTVEQKVKEAVNKVADTANVAASTIGDALNKAGERVEEFFDDRKNVVVNEDLANAAESAMDEEAEDIEDAEESLEENIVKEETLFEDEEETE